MSRTCLHETHRTAGATLVDFHGWEMPIRYSAIPEEHRSVRESCGLFDLCHMGRLEFTGPDAVAWVDRVVTVDTRALDPGSARYGFITAADGGIIDDVIVYRLPEAAAAETTSPERIFVVVNASNRADDVAWFREQQGELDARLEDLTDSLGMLAIQGPRAEEILGTLVEESQTPLSTLPYYHVTGARLAGLSARTVWIASTGYTGERGFEIYLDTESTPALWNRILKAGGDRIVPVGLGARDTLRVEAGMPLYGNELTRDTNPFEAGLGFAVKLAKETHFVGQDRLAEIKSQGPARRLRGFRIDSRKIARTGMQLYDGERLAGTITSGIPSPTLGYPVAMGYVDSSVDANADLEVEIRGQRFPARREKLPFYSRVRKSG